MMSHISSVQKRSGGMCWYKITRNVVLCLCLISQVFMTGELVLLCPSINSCGIGVEGLLQCPVAQKADVCAETCKMV